MRWLSAIPAPVNGGCCALSHAQRGPDGAWDSSYATAWSLMALSQVIKGTGELSGSYDFSATLNSLPIASGQAGLEVGPVQAAPRRPALPSGSERAGYPARRRERTPILHGSAGSQPSCGRCCTPKRAASTWLERTSRSMRLARRSNARRCMKLRRGSWWRVAPDAHLRTGSLLPAAGGFPARRG